MSQNKLPVLIPLTIFALSVSVSHIVLPAIHKSNLLPFFDWQIYNLIPTEVTRYDLIVRPSASKERADKSIYVSHASDMNTRLRVKLWLLCENLAENVAAKSDYTKELKTLMDNLNVENLTPVALVRIVEPFDKYLLRSADSLESSVEVIYEFR